MPLSVQPDSLTFAVVQQVCETTFSMLTQANEEMTQLRQRIEGLERMWQESERCRYELALLRQSRAASRVGHLAVMCHHRITVQSSLYIINMCTCMHLSKKKRKDGRAGKCMTHRVLARVLRNMRLLMLTANLVEGGGPRPARAV